MDASDILGDVAGDLALVQAIGNNAANPSAQAFSGGVALNATLAALTAPSSVVIAATVFTVKETSALFLAGFTYQYTLSGAGTVTVVLRTFANVTGMAGGAVSGGWRVENGGTPVTVAGDAPVTQTTLVQSDSAANTKLMTFTGPLEFGKGMVGVELVATSAVNLSAQTLSAIFARL